MPRPASTVVTSKPARVVLGLLRLAVGFVFLWSFLDKTFGLHYSTGPSRAWINGGTPAQSYLTGATTGKPLASFFESLAVPAMDWLFMMGLLGIGVALVLGIGTRLAAVAGVVMLGFMYAAVAPWVWGSLNPVVNEHLVYALVLIVAIPLTSAGDTLGLGSWWKGWAGEEAALPHLIRVDEAMVGFPVAASALRGGDSAVSGLSRWWGCRDGGAVAFRGFPIISHVIPAHIFQTLKFGRWNCNVCGGC